MTRPGWTQQVSKVVIFVFINYFLPLVMTKTSNRFVKIGEIQVSRFVKDMQPDVFGIMSSNKMRKVSFWRKIMKILTKLIVGLSYCFSKLLFLLLPFISSLPTSSPPSICCLVSSCHSTAIILPGGLVICIYSYPPIPVCSELYCT